MKPLRTLFLALCLATLAPAYGQQARVGYLAASHPMENDRLAQAFIRGMEDLGYAQGRNLVFEKRTAGGRLELLPALASELAAAKVDVIVAPPTVAALAAVQAGGRIPVVFMLVSDPVGSGLAASLARPGGMATGLSNQSEDLAAKLVELLKEAVPAARRVVVLASPGSPVHDAQFAQAAAAAARMNIVLLRVGAGDYAGVDEALREIERLRPHGMVVLADPVFVSRREHIVARANAMRLPVIYGFSEFTDAGGLMSYGVNLAEQFRRGAYYVDRILKGARPADLPIEQPASFEFVINTRAAAEIGLALPRELRLRATRVIE